MHGDRKTFSPQGFNRKSELVDKKAGVVAVIGAVSVYIKMNNEEQDVKKSIMMIIGACIFLVACLLYTSSNRE